MRTDVLAVVGLLAGVVGAIMGAGALWTSWQTRHYRDQARDAAARARSSHHRARACMARVKAVADGWLSPREAADLQTKADELGPAEECRHEGPCDELGDARRCVRAAAFWSSAP